MRLEDMMIDIAHRTRQRRQRKKHDDGSNAAFAERPVDRPIDRFAARSSRV
jgi:hypothetical protein